MRHRLVSGTGLGNPEKCLLDNKWTDNEFLNSRIRAMLCEAIDCWFKDIDGVDFGIKIANKNITVDFGIEPAYMYQDLRIFSINTDNGQSYNSRGRAWGCYGSNIVKKTKYYTDYKYNSKFKKFVDKWSEELNKYIS